VPSEVVLRTYDDPTLPWNISPPDTSAHDSAASWVIESTEPTVPFGPVRNEKAGAKIRDHQSYTANLRDSHDTNQTVSWDSAFIPTAPVSTIGGGAPTLNRNGWKAEGRNENSSNTSNSLPFTTSADSARPPEPNPEGVLKQFPPLGPEVLPVKQMNNRESNTGAPLLERSPSQDSSICSERPDQPEVQVLTFAQIDMTLLKNWNPDMPDARNKIGEGVFGTVYKAKYEGKRSIVQSRKKCT